MAAISQTIASMSQSSKIFGALGIGFIVYITLRGELPSYAAVLFGPAPSTASTNATSSGGAGFNPAAVDAADTGQSISTGGSSTSGCSSTPYAPATSKDSYGNPVVNCGNCGIYNGVTGLCDPL